MSEQEAMAILLFAHDAQIMNLTEARRVFMAIDVQQRNHYRVVASDRLKATAEISADSSGKIALATHAPGMEPNNANLATNVISLPMNQGCVMTFANKTQDGWLQSNLWLENSND